MRNETDYMKREANKVLTSILDVIDEHLRANPTDIHGDRELILSIEERIRKKAV